VAAKAAAACAPYDATSTAAQTTGKCGTLNKLNTIFSGRIFATSKDASAASADMERLRRIDSLIHLVQMTKEIDLPARKILRLVTGRMRGWQVAERQEVDGDSGRPRSGAPRLLEEIHLELQRSRAQIEAAQELLDALREEVDDEESDGDGDATKFVSYIGLYEKGFEVTKRYAATFEEVVVMMREKMRLGQKPGRPCMGDVLAKLNALDANLPKKSKDTV